MAPVIQSLLVPGLGSQLVASAQARGSAMLCCTLGVKFSSVMIDC